MLGLKQITGALAVLWALDDKHGKCTGKEEVRVSSRAGRGQAAEQSNWAVPQPVGGQDLEDDV